jgi:hypothetical protein
MPKEIRNPNDEGETCGSVRTGLAFGLCHSFVIRHSDFVIFHRLLQARDNGPLTTDNEP